MTHPIGSFGPLGRGGLVYAALDRVDATADATDPKSEHATGQLAAMKTRPSSAERERVAGQPAESADADSTEPGDDGPQRSGTSALDMAPPAASMAAMAERVAQSPLHRLPGDGAPIRRIDRRRKRSC